MDDEDLFGAFDAAPTERKRKQPPAKTASPASRPRSAMAVDGEDEAAGDEPADDAPAASTAKRLKRSHAADQGTAADAKDEKDESAAVAARSASGKTAGAASDAPQPKLADAFSSTAASGQGQDAVKHTIRHEVALPPGYNYIPLSEHKPDREPARKYPFALDPFQKYAVASIERNESVLVAAHTSAGKTVVAEYAIAQSLRDKQRVIYTSPIKALSNQKYREFSEEFGDVGLVTGDVTINPGASCLVMTTEILRSMLYRGSEVVREVAWVIFDEVHYMRDKERGVVWEEAIILIPKTVHFVFLSATIPNAFQFAQWITKLHEQPCHVVYTDYRPTPLQHYVFPAGGDGIHLVVDEHGRFREDNFQKAVASLNEAEGPNIQKNQGKGKKGGNKKGGSTDLNKIVKMIMERSYQPCIVFSFSKRECEGNAMQMSKLDFTEETEKKLIDNIFTNAIDSLSEDDRTLPQIQHILPLLRRGIGIHHSGLLPILKEVIEILFQEGYIKVLFATETFSIGLNMPAKTVVFTSVRKWDGKAFRWLGGGEYIQMSGRAGRRGIDDRGIVILMMEEKMEPTAAIGMLKGEADRLDSAFHLSYNMILNMIRMEGLQPEYMLERSFYQFQHASSVPELEQKVAQLESSRDAIVITDEEAVAEYHAVRTQLASLSADVRAIVHHPSYCLPFLQPGRLVRIAEGGQEFGWGVVVSFQKKVNNNNSKNQDAPKDDEESLRFIVDVLIRVASRSVGTAGGTASGGLPVVRPCPEGDRGDALVVPVSLSALNGLSAARIVLPKDLRPEQERRAALKSIEEVKRRFSHGLPMLDPIEDMGIKDETFKKLIKKIEALEQRMADNSLSKQKGNDSQHELYASKLAMTEEIKGLKKQIKQATNILQMEELKSRKRVLRRLGYLSSADVIEMKGRVACEISTGDELLLSEMIFDGVFNDLTVEQTCALLSCFVFQEKASDETPVLKEELAGPLRKMQEFARRIAKVSVESKLAVDEEAYVKGFRPELMDVTFSWSNGSKFSQLVKMTDVFEGSIIRAIRRLDELLRQMAAAAQAIGNGELEQKFSQGMTKIRRDIIFAASLYL